MARQKLTTKQLEDFRRSQDRQLFTIAFDATTEFEKVLRRYRAEFQSALNNANFSDQKVQRLAEATELSQRLEDYLRSAGLPEALEKFGYLHNDVKNLSMKYFELIEKPATLSGASTASLNYVVKGNFDSLQLKVESSLVAPLSNALIQGVFAARPRGDIVQELISFSDNLSLGQTQTLVDDMYQRFQRETRNTHAEELGLEFVQFINPIDSKTRPACRFMATTAKYGVPGLWKKSEFNTKLTPELSQDPLVAGGGWNCRGEVYYLDETEAKSLGAKF